MSGGRNRWREIVILGVFCWFFFFYGLAAFGLLGADEPRYAQIAREMLERHDWVTPTLNQQPWLEKPVLYYWCAKISYAAFGVSDGAARLPAAALAALMVAAIFSWMKRLRAAEMNWLHPDAAFDAALITCSTAGIFGFARGASTDMPLAACFTMAMLAWWLGWQTQRRRWLLAFYFFLAGAALAKGPVAVVLAAGVVVGFAIVLRQARVLWWTLWWPGVAVFLAVCLPWYGLVQARNPQFFREFILQHNLERFATNLYQHPHPFWYYVPVLLIGLLPWTALAIAGLANAGRAWRIKPGEDEEGTKRRQVMLFLAIWAVVPIVFFSFSTSKLPGYILPALPAWTLLAAIYLAQKRQTGERFPAGLTAAHALMPAIVMGSLVVGPGFLVDRHAHVPANVFLVGAGVAILTFLILLWSVQKYGPAMVRVATLIPMILALGYTLRAVAPVVDATQSARPVARDLAERGYGKWPVAVHNVPRSLEYGLGFYRNQKIYREDELRGRLHLLVESRSRPSQAMPLAPAEATEAGGGFPAQHLEYWQVLPPETSWRR
jgi:4-amino-4-deoxy-L-arabinose transferase-like glycosyltransferase